MVQTGKVSLFEAFPIGAWRRQAKAKLAPPTASFEGQTVLLIGATGYILSEAARILADLHVSRLIFGVRNVAKGEALANELQSNHGSGLSIDVLEVDLLSFENVRKFASMINDLGTIDVIVMGSAIMNNETRVTKDGWEETLQLVHLSSALLILLLLPKLLANENAKPIVLCSVTSSAIRSTSLMVKLPAKREKSYLQEVNHVKTPKFQKDGQYGISKIIHACWIYELCSYLPASRVHFHQLDPGACITPLTANHKTSRLLLRWIARSVEMCARTVVNSCLPLAGSHGKLLEDYVIVAYPSFMERPAGDDLRWRAWNETTQVLVKIAPETEGIIAALTAKKLQ